MKKAVLLIFALSLAFGLLAQTHKVKIIRDDRIVTKNGRTTAECSQPLNNVRISFPYTPATVSTDGNGLASVPKDGKKNSYEIKQIRCQDYFLPDSLNIYNKPYAYETGKVNTIRMVSKQHYEDGIKKRTARLEKQIQEFRKRQQQDNAKFQQYEDSIATLNKMIDNVPKDILEILTTDFSNYTEEELKMQQLFDEGDYDAITANADKVNRQIDLVETAQQKIDSAKQSLFITLPIMAKSFANKLNFDSATYYYTKAADMFDTNFQAQIAAGSYFLIHRTNHDLALKYYNRALHIAEKNNDSLKIATAYTSLGNLYQHICMLSDIKDYFDKALEYSNKALEIRKAILGEEHIDLAISYKEIGSIYLLRNDYDKALKYFDKALMIEINTSDEKDIRILCTYSTIGFIYSQKGDYNKALEYYNKALTIHKANLDKSDIINEAYTYYNVGYIYYKKSDYNKALEYCNKVLLIAEASSGDLIFFFVNPHKLIAKVYSALGDTVKEEEFRKKAEEIERRLK